MAKNNSGNFTISLGKADMGRMGEVARFMGISRENLVRGMIREAHENMVKVQNESKISGEEAESIETDSHDESQELAARYPTLHD